MSEQISNVPERLDIRAKQGATLSFTLDFFLADEVTPLVITGSVATLQVRKSRKSNTPLLSVAGVIGTTVGVDDNRATFNIPAATMAGLLCGCWIHDIDRTDGAGVVTPVTLGSFEVVADV